MRTAEKMLTVDEVAESLRVTSRTVRRLCESGKIPAVRVGKVWRIHPEQFRAEYGIPVKSTSPAA